MKKDWYSDCHIALVDTGIEDIEPLKNLNHLDWLAIYGNDRL